jgi:hypothetical protein
MTVKSMMRLGVLIGLTLESIPSRAEGRITASSLWAGKLLDIAVAEAQAEYNADPESTAAAYTFTNAYYASYYNRLAEKTWRDVFFTEDQAFIFNNEAARQALPGSSLSATPTVATPRNTPSGPTRALSSNTPRPALVTPTLPSITPTTAGSISFMRTITDGDVRVRAALTPPGR